MLQTFVEVLIPAIARGVIVTVTVAESLEQGPVPAFVYVYIPAKSKAGLNILLPLDSAGDQVPPVCAVGPNNVNKFTGD